MEAMNDDLSSEVQLWKIIYGLAGTLVLRCAVQLDLATIIHNHGAAMTLPELSQRLPDQPVNEDVLYRIMRYLVHMKLFALSSTDGVIKYGLTSMAKFLVKGWDRCMVDEILFLTDKEFSSPYYILKDALSTKNDTTIAEKALGVDPWLYMEVNPEKSRIFNEALATDTRLNISVLVTECKSSFDGITTLVDVGGGTGTAAMHIAKAFPHIKCTVFDLPHVIAHAPCDSEVEFVGGDMFKSIPRADAIMMKSILHDWDDVKCVEILKRCKEAVPREGKLIIIDVVMEVEPEDAYTNMRMNFDIQMMLISGKERKEEEWKKLFGDAGYLGGYKITRINARPSLIEAFPY